MGTRGLKSLLEQMQKNIQEMMDIADKVENGKVSSKDSLNVESRLVVDIFSIRSKANIISTFIADFVDNLK